eukprot:m51a1_g11169 hypothetical protein (372) ;mRNA; r:303390-304563
MAGMKRSRTMADTALEGERLLANSALWRLPQQPGLPECSAGGQVAKTPKNRRAATGSPAASPPSASKRARAAKSPKSQRSGKQQGEKPRAVAMEGPIYNEAPTELEMAVRDKDGNVASSTADLVRDGAFSSHPDLNRVVVLDYCDINFGSPSTALRKKGFEAVTLGVATTAEELARELARCGQLWVISDHGLNPRSAFGAQHVELISDFWASGRGLYLWGDNAPYFDEANAIARKLLGVELTGDVHGDHVVARRPEGREDGTGFCDHPVVHGLDNLYEGATVSSVARGSGTSAALRDVMVGSDGTVVIAAYEAEGRRCVIDGGFTRLFYKWDAAGTGRYVVNAASWLANVERFVVPEAAESAPAPAQGTTE